MKKVLFLTCLMSFSAFAAKIDLTINVDGVDARSLKRVQAFSSFTSTSPLCLQAAYSSITAIPVLDKISKDSKVEIVGAEKIKVEINTNKFKKGNCEYKFDYAIVNLDVTDKERYGIELQSAIFNTELNVLNPTNSVDINCASNKCVVESKKQFLRGNLPRVELGYPRIHVDGVVMKGKINFIHTN